MSSTPSLSWILLLLSILIILVSASTSDKEEEEDKGAMLRLTEAEHSLLNREKREARETGRKQRKNKKQKRKNGSKTRKGKSGKRGLRKRLTNKKRTKQQRKSSPSRSVREAVKGKNCEYVVLDDIGSRSESTCAAGQKFLVRPTSDCRRQYLILKDPVRSGENKHVILFLQKKTATTAPSKVVNCLSSLVDITATAPKCKVK